MGRKARPRVWRDWYVTETGGKMHKLCPVRDGIEAASAALEDYLARVEKDREEARRAGLAPICHHCAGAM
jgi:hypothetical protein